MNMIFRIFRISGHSMHPTLKPGGRVIVSSIPYIFSKPKVGDVIAFRYTNKMLIKRAVRIEEEKYYLRGDNKSDTLKTEPILKNEILGKMILILHT